MNSTADNDPRDHWDNPLATRYASAERTRLWSDNHRYRLWRQTWLALAVALSIAGVLILVIVKREHQRMKQEQALIDEESAGA